MPRRHDVVEGDVRRLKLSLTASPMTLEEVCKVFGWSKIQASRRLKKISGVKDIMLEGSGHSHTKALSLYEIFGGYTLQKLYYLNEESLIGWFCKNVKKGDRLTRWRITLMLSEYQISKETKRKISKILCTKASHIRHHPTV